MPLVLDNGGVASRDLIYVDDIVRGLFACATDGAPGDVYNLASGVETTVRRLAELVIELSGSDSELELGPRRAWDHSVMRFGSTEKAGANSASWRRLCSKTAYAARSNGRARTSR